MARIRTIKRAIPQATRRSVALAAGAIPDEASPVACHYCGAIGSAWWPALRGGRPGSWVAFVGVELDHVIPEFHGGAGTPDNVVLACRSCNRSKKDKTVDDWRGRG